MKLKEHWKRLIAGFMGVLMFCGIFFSGSMTAYAWTNRAGETCSSLVGGRYTGSDGQYYYTPNYAPYLVYDENGNTHIGTTDSRHARRKLLLSNGGETQQVYCVEAEVEFDNSSDGYTSMNGENSRYFQNLPFSVQYGILCASVYGWQPGKPLPIEGINEDDYSYATQMIIWEYQQQIRTSPTDRHDNGEISGSMYYDSLAGRPAELAYNWILEQIANHGRIPSFAGFSAENAPCYTMKYDHTTGRYSLTLTDENQVLSGLCLEGNHNGISVSRNGNQYTFSTDQMISSPVTIGIQKEMALYGTGLLIWGRPGYQTMMTGVQDPLRFFIRLETETFGTCKIVKESEDGVVSGIRFTISGNGVNESVTTGADGTVDIELLPGVYTVTEQAADRYEPQNSQTMTIASGQTSSVTFSNILKRGDLKVVKTSEDSLVEGVTFHLYGTSLSGLPVDEYAVTDAQGIAVFRNVLVSGSTPYTIEEVETAIRYVVPAAQNTPIQWKEVTSRSFTNVLKKFHVTVTKADGETGTSQGNASLAGAVYGIYKGEELIDTYVTDSNGQFTTKEYVCGYDWTIREISPSEGYLLDSTIHAVGAEPELYTVEYNSTANNVHEQIIKGKIAVIKHTDNGETQIETPEAGAVFEVWLKEAGSYEAAKETERDILTCDENGFAQTKDLPYGIYTVCQTEGWAGRELMKPFDVYICQDGNTYHYLINNAYFESYIKIVKKDVETGNVIPYAGVGFQLYDPDGKLITMTFTYPEVTTIDTFYTTADGGLITPEKLPYGTGYSIVEVQAPYGYVLNPEPVPFDVVQEESGEESGITVIEVVRSNMAQKGTITVSKSGEVFSSVSENEGLYQPVFAVTSLEGAVYEITAAEDIVTPDGTLRTAQGEVVDTVTTGADGMATSEELYLGRYEVKEVAAPYGFVLNGEVHGVELAYAGQEIAVTETTAHFVNERQRVEIDLVKSLMADEAYGIGGNGEIFDVAFGLYAESDLTAADGRVIPADGLIEVVFMDETGKGTVRTDLPMGCYYVQEISTNAAYRINDSKYPVTFEYAGQETASVFVSANGGEAIENKLFYGTVSGKKSDEDGQALGGAVIGIFKPGTAEFTKENAVAVTVSAEDGSFSFENVPYGTWTIRELESPEGFILSKEEIAVTISEAGEIAEIGLINESIRGNITLTKIDEDYPENKLAGAVFEVYADTNGDGKLDEGDMLLGSMEEQAGGVYRMDGLRYGRYLVREKAAPAGFVLDENVYAVSVEENGKSYVVENQAGVGFINAAQKGSLKIVKTSSDGKVEGFSFRITGTNYDQTFRTDSNGEITIDGLRIGDYTVTEVNDKAAEAYILPADRQVAVQAGATTIVEMYNELRDTPKTGDDFNAALWVGLSALSVAGVGFLGVIGSRKKTSEKKSRKERKGRK